MYSRYRIPPLVAPERSQEAFRESVIALYKIAARNLLIAECPRASITGTFWALRNALRDLGIDPDSL